MFPNIQELNIYIVCGKTELRKGIGGLAASLRELYGEDEVPYNHSLFLCKRRIIYLTLTNKRQDILAKVKDKFYTWLDDLVLLPKTKLSKAVNYGSNQRDALAVVLTNDQLEISERAIKKLVMGGKNWLFSTSSDGAEASGIIPSVMRTAEANGLDTHPYLEILFEEIPTLEVPDDFEDLQDYLSWSSKMRECPII